MSQKQLDRLSAVGIHPQSLAGRLRLVLVIGCYRDFRFTRDILSTSPACGKVEAAIEVLEALGARCDCEVLAALGELPRGVLWHNRAAPADADLDANKDGSPGGMFGKLLRSYSTDRKNDENDS